MSEAARRDALVRMATDPEFAERVRTQPDVVAGECGLSAADLAALAALGEGSAAAGPDALGERLSKSAIFSGGVISSLFSGHQAAPDLSHDDVAGGHHIEHPGDRAGAARTQEFNTPDDAHQDQGWMLDNGHTPGTTSLLAGHDHSGTTPVHDGGNPAAAGGDGDGLRPIVVPPGSHGGETSLMGGEAGFLSGGYDHSSATPVHGGDPAGGGGEGHGTAVPTIGDEAGRPGGGQTFGGGGETSSGGTGGDPAGAVMYPPVMNPTDPGNHTDVIPHHDDNSAGGKPDGGDGKPPIKPDGPKLEDFNSRIDNPQDVSHTTAHDNAAGKDDGGDKGDKPIKPDDGPKPPKLDDFISRTDDVANVAHTGIQDGPGGAGVTFNQVSSTAP